eukprot:7333642-Prymnesium_polylepis.1
MKYFLNPFVGAVSAEARLLAAPCRAHIRGCATQRSAEPSAGKAEGRLGANVSIPVTLPKFAARSPARSSLWNDIRAILLAWYHRLSAERLTTDEDAVVDTKAVKMCTVHAHLLLICSSCCAT